MNIYTMQMLYYINNIKDVIEVILTLLYVGNTYHFAHCIFFLKQWNCIQYSPFSLTHNAWCTFRFVKWYQGVKNMPLPKFVTKCKPIAHFFILKKELRWKFQDGIRTYSQARVQNEINLHKLKKGNYCKLEPKWHMNKLCVSQNHKAHRMA